MRELRRFTANVPSAMILPTFGRQSIMSNVHARQSSSDGGDTGIVLVANPSHAFPAEQGQRLRDLLERQPEVSVIAEIATHEPPATDQWIRFWTGPAANVSILIDPPAPAGPLAVRRAAWDAVGPLRPVDAPLWDWLIRAARAGVTIHPLRADPAQAGSALPRLAPARPPKERDWLRAHLQQVEPAGADASRNSAIEAIALRAGLFLWHDYLEEGHELCQSIEGEGEDRPGDYWHAIMHRREPDYANAKYWFRRLGAHANFQNMPAAVDRILAVNPAADAALWRNRLLPGERWNPVAFVDFCEECARNEESESARFARQIQRAEMALLLGISRSRLAR